MTSTDWGDLFRVGVLAAGSASFGITLFVVAHYAKVYRNHRRRSNLANWRGLLPLHVSLIGLSHLMLVGGTMYETYIRVNEPLTWRGPLFFTANVIGAYALWIILGNNRARKANLTTHESV